MRILFGYLDTRKNEEDLAITPYLFGVAKLKTKEKFIGIGLCWIYSAFYVVIGKGFPKDYPTFTNLTN